MSKTIEIQMQLTARTIPTFPLKKSRASLSQHGFPRSVANFSLTLIKPVQHGELARLLNLASQEDLVQDRIHFVKVKDEIQLAHVAKEAVQHLDEQVDRLEVGQLIVVGIDADAEKETSISPIDDLVVAVLQSGRQRIVGWTRSQWLSRCPPSPTHLDKVALILLIPRGYKSMHLSLQPHLLIVVHRHIVLGQACLALPVLDEEPSQHGDEISRVGWWFG